MHAKYVYTLKPGVQKHTAVQNQLCRSAALQNTPYLSTYFKLLYPINNLFNFIHSLYINLNTWKLNGALNA